MNSFIFTHIFKFISILLIYILIICYNITILLLYEIKILVKSISHQCFYLSITSSFIIYIELNIKIISFCIILSNFKQFLMNVSTQRIKIIIN